jgi:hypothetical protein
MVSSLFLGEVSSCRHAIPSTDNHRLPTTGCLQDRVRFGHHQQAIQRSHTGKSCSGLSPAIRPEPLGRCRGHHPSNRLSRGRYRHAVSRTPSAALGHTCTRKPG